ncbi:hypothetical protein GCM10010917_32520 [Paenibacillus physcomitrellae]|uniref:Uncharacterized protein n=1 Tax=Paenibacillus physcomitrellae TaxID=1619311 RepID=A0ABQ1GIU6_9BACL|nr:hypothetical protein GCM10010917_32520 [Paenibacillus physcomitrellae]
MLNKSLAPGVRDFILFTDAVTILKTLLALLKMTQPALREGGFSIENSMVFDSGFNLCPDHRRLCRY